MMPADQGKTGALPDAVGMAANDDRGPLRAPAPETMPSVTHVGWDAFEVWRSRVRDPRRAASRAIAE
jgi:hypothetical protein